MLFQNKTQRIPTKSVFEILLSGGVSTNLYLFSQKELGGGAILDLGVYVLQFAQYIFKEEPKKVTAIGELNSDGVDVLETVILEYGNSRRAVLNTHTKVLLVNEATVFGTKGHATVSTYLNQKKRP